MNIPDNQISTTVPTTSTETTKHPVVTSSEANNFIEMLESFTISDVKELQELAKAMRKRIKQDVLQH